MSYRTREHWESPLVPETHNASSAWHRAVGGDGPVGFDRWLWIALVLPLVALAPLLYMQCRLLMLKPHLQFFPLAIAAACYFYNEKTSQANGLSQGRGDRQWAFYLWIATLFLCFCALYFGSPWLAHLCAILLTAIWALRARPFLSLLRISGIAGLLLVTLPPPFGWDKFLIGGLQAFSSFACSRLMDLTQILHVRRGNIIEITSKPLFVEEACSGVDSQYALMAVAGVLLLLGRAGFWVSFLTIVTVPIWAILGNLLRIYLIVLGLEWFDVDLSQGTVHTLLGLLVFVFTAWVHWSSVQLLNYLQLTWFSRDDSSPSVAADGEERRELGQDLASSTVGMPAAWMALPLGLLVFFPESLQAVVDYHTRPDLPSISLEDSERFPGAGALLQADGFQVVGFETAYRDRDDMLGQHSRIWEMQSGSGPVTVCLDFPFRGWHPLWECYINSGWQRVRSDLIDSASGSFFETVLRNDLGDLAILHFSLFDEDGNAYEYLGSTEYRKQSQRWSNTLFKRRRPGDRIDEPLTFQFQQIAYTGVGPTPEELNQLREIFQRNRSEILSKSRVALQRIKGHGSNEPR